MRLFNGAMNISVITLMAIRIAAKTEPEFIVFLLWVLAAEKSWKSLFVAGRNGQTLYFRNVSLTGKAYGSNARMALGVNCMQPMEI